MTPYIIAGLVTGSIYAIATLGLILTYTSSRIFNFAFGAMAFFVAMTFRELVVVHGWSTWAAAAVAIFVVSPLIGLFLWAILFRRLNNSPASVRLVSTIGLWVAIPPLARLLFGADEVFDRTGLGPSPSKAFTFFDVVIDSNQLIVIAAVVVIALGLTVLLRATPFGLSTRATVDSPVTARIVGVNTSGVTAISWMIGTMLAGIAGVLLVPIFGYSELQFTSLILGAFAACVVARMHNLILGVVGALLIGILQNIVRSSQAEDFLVNFFPRGGVIMNGLPASIPFIVMLVFLLAYRGMGRERFTTDTRAAEPEVIVAGPDRRRSRARRLMPYAVVLAVILLLPEMLSGLWLAVIAKGLALGIAFLSYTIVAGEGGMISLCQVTFAGIGGAITAQLAVNTGMSVLVAILLGGLIAIPIGVLAALPSLRLGDLYLALATLAFALLVENTYFQLPGLNNDGSGLPVPRPRLGSIGFTNDRPFYYLLVALFVLAALFVVWLRRSTSGLAFSAVRSSETAAATAGVSIVRTKLFAFGASAFIAAVGGGLYVTYAQRAIPAQQFATLLGVVWFAIVVTWGVRSPIGALLAGLSFAVFPFLFSQHLSGRWLEVPTLLFGLGAIGLAREPRGIVYDVVHKRKVKRARRAARRAAGSGPLDSPPDVSPTPSAVGAA